MSMAMQTKSSALSMTTAATEKEKAMSQDEKRDEDPLDVCKTYKVLLESLKALEELKKLKTEHEKREEEY